MAERGEKTCSGVRNPQSLRLHRPVLPELEFRRRLLGDEETMAYNHAYGGTASFPEKRWDDWYARWIGDSSGKRFYRYLGDAERNCFVGEAAYYFDDDRNCYICSVIVLAAERRKGFGKQGLRLICEAARKNGVRYLYDDIAADNPSVALFFSCGFEEVDRTEEYVMVRKALSEVPPDGSVL